MAFLLSRAAVFDRLGECDDAPGVFDVQVLDQLAVQHGEALAAALGLGVCVDDPARPPGSRVPVPQCAD